MEAFDITSAQISIFSLYNDPNYASYAAMFKLGNDRINSYTNNGGQYGSSVLARAFDNNLSTHWETGKPNSSTFTNNIVVKFNSIETINRLVYAVRQDNGWKGYPLTFRIYASLTDTIEDFVLVCEGSSISSKNLTEFRFPSTQFKRLKFEYVKANGDWASASEFWFFKPDTTLDAVNDLFTDNTMSELKPQYNSSTILDNLIASAMTHPLQSYLMDRLNLAKYVLANSPALKNSVITLTQRGNYSKEQTRTQTAYPMYAIQPTGYYVNPLETITVYVEADPMGVMPQLVFGQFADHKNDWKRFYNLSIGKNVITAESIDTMNPASIYFANQAMPTDQAYPPRVRFEGGTKFPSYIHGITDPNDYFNQLEAYVAKVDYNDADFANGNPPGQFYNITELVSKNNIIVTSASGAYVGLKEQFQSNGRTAAHTMDAWEDMYYQFAKYSGFDTVDQTSNNFMPRGTFNSRVFTKGPYGWATNGYTGYNGGTTPTRDDGFFKEIVKASGITNGGWVYYHEWGHVYDNSSTVTHESTNNLFSLMMEDRYNYPSRMLREDRWGRYVINYHNTKEPITDQITIGGLTYQLEGVFGRTLVGKAHLYARNNRTQLSALANNPERFAVCLSFAAGYNLLFHYIYYGFVISDAAKNLVKNLPAYNKKTYYVTNKNFEVDAKPFVNPNVKPTLKAEGNSAITLTMDIVEDDKALLCYELYRDGNYLGVTYNNVFVDKNVQPNTVYNYSVIAYDRKLNPSQMSDVVAKNSGEPIISVNNNITIKLNQSFNPLAYALGMSPDGIDITSSITVASSNVDVTKKGFYTVVYSLIYNGIPSTKAVTVNVVSDFVYASDMTQTSAKVGWGSFQKDKSPSGNVISLYRSGISAPYAKGLGTHANSEVIYNVSDMGFYFFEAFIGIDQATKGLTIPSGTFEVWVDNVKVYGSKVFKSDTEQEFVKLPIMGAKEVKLITTDANDGNSSDHTVWADAKFTTNNSKPKLTIPKSVAIFLGETVDLIGSYSAIDIEDGDITSKVTVVPNVDLTTPGNYPVTYTVTDSDGNTVSKQRFIAVVSPNSFKYLTDYNWTVGKIGYGSIGVNLAVSKNPIRLTDINGQMVQYDKGLGTHAYSEIIYDLSSLNFKIFTTEVGVDRAMYNSVASISFEIWIDGVKQFDSDLMLAKTSKKYARVSIVDAKELKLIIRDGGNGISSDHGDWADTKLYYN